MRGLVMLLVLLLSPSLLLAGHIADVELFDRTSGTTLPIHEHRGRLYVAGEPGHQYEIRVRNSSPRRLLAVTSVDGVNVISGETASQQQSGYVLASHDSVSIEGWRKSLADVATFYFTSHGDSYAARTQRPDDVGVIGVALFRERIRERIRCCERFAEKQRSANDAAAPSTTEAESAGARRDEPRLGTGHGEREYSAAQYVDFERSSPTPEETIVIYYDSRRNLIAQGVLPRHRAANAQHGPKPFPKGFVPDP